MRALGYGLLGALLGSVGGFWIGLMGGLIYADVAQVSCFDGSCGTVAGAIGALAAALAALAGAVHGVRRGLSRGSDHPARWSAQ
jgi:hypothetical protein